MSGVCVPVLQKYWGQHEAAMGAFLANVVAHQIEAATKNSRALVIKQLN